MFFRFFLMFLTCNKIAYAHRPYLHSQNSQKYENNDFNNKKLKKYWCNKKASTLALFSLCVLSFTLHTKTKANELAENPNTVGEATTTNSPHAATTMPDKNPNTVGEATTTNSPHAATTMPNKNPNTVGEATTTNSPHAATTMPDDVLFLIFEKTISGEDNFKKKLKHLNCLSLTNRNLREKTSQFMKKIKLKPLPLSNPRKSFNDINIENKDKQNLLENIFFDHFMLMILTNPTVYRRPKGSFFDEALEEELKTSLKNSINQIINDITLDKLPGFIDYLYLLGFFQYEEGGDAGLNVNRWSFSLKEHANFYFEQTKKDNNFLQNFIKNNQATKGYIERYKIFGQIATVWQVEEQLGL